MIRPHYGRSGASAGMPGRHPTIRQSSPVAEPKPLGSIGIMEKKKETAKMALYNA